jgi:hypothetical protein
LKLRDQALARERAIPFVGAFTVDTLQSALASAMRVCSACSDRATTEVPLRYEVA